MATPDRARRLLVLLASAGIAALAGCAMVGCGGGGAADSDAAPRPAIDGAVTDAVSGDARSTGTDGGAGGDAGATTADASAADAAPADAVPVPDATTWLESHVHIYIDNFCNTSVDPASFTVPAGSTLSLSYHNHSVDYEADVWLSYGGGYLELARGDTWDDQFTHCSGPNPYTAYADISIAGGGGSSCPGVRLYINCQ